ncbi:hypothetical protein ACHWQZ_G014705 [Mnemiopsis leidyi]
MTTVNDKELEDLLARCFAWLPKATEQVGCTEPVDVTSINSLERDLRDSDEESGDDMSILIGDSEDEDSEIEFSEGSDDEDD